MKALECDFVACSESMSVWNDQVDYFQVYGGDLRLTAGNIWQIGTWSRVSQKLKYSGLWVWLRSFLLIKGRATWYGIWQLQSNQSWMPFEVKSRCRGSDGCEDYFPSTIAAMAIWPCSQRDQHSIESTFERWLHRIRASSQRETRKTAVPEALCGHDRIRVL